MKNILKRMGVCLFAVCLIVGTVSASAYADYDDFGNEINAEVFDENNLASFQEALPESNPEPQPEPVPEPVYVEPVVPEPVYVAPEPEPAPAPTPVKRETPTSCWIDNESLIIYGIPGGARLTVETIGDLGIIYDGQYRLNERGVTPGLKVYIVNPGDGVTTLDSDAQVLTVPEKPKPDPVKNPTPTTASFDKNTLSVIGIPVGGKISFDGYNYTNVINDGSYNCGSIQLTDGMPIYVILAGDGVTTLDSDPQIVHVSLPVIKVKRDKPSATFSGVNITLNNVPDSSQYSLDGGASWIGTSGGTVQLTESTLHGDYNVLVQALARNDSEENSDVQHVDIAKADKPLGVATNPATATALGSLVNVAPGQEYRKSGSGAWTAIQSGTVPGLDPGNYDVRVAAQGHIMASDFVTVTVTKQEGTKLPTPQAVFTGSNLLLSQLSVGMSISFNNGGMWSVISDGACTSLTLTQDQVNQAIANGGIKVYRVGKASENTLDSDIQTIPVSKAQTPTGIKVTNAANNANGALSGLSNDMQYKKDGQNNWIDIGSSTVGGLTPGKYYVRRRANGTMVASDAATVSIGNNSSKNKEATPTAEFNTWNMVLYGIKGCRFSTDNGNNWSNTYTDDNATIKESSINISYGIIVYRPGNGSTTTDSDRQYIKLYKHNAPLGIGAVSATNSANGQITGVNSSLQYAREGGSWMDCPNGSVVGLAPGKYYVRVRGTHSTMPSDSVVVIIQQTAAAVPTAVVTPTPAATTVINNSASSVMKATTNVNIRKEPNTNCDVLGKAVKGSEVIVIGTANGWSHISCNGIDGYIKSEYLEASGTQETKKTEEKKETTEAPKPAEEKTETTETKTETANTDETSENKTAEANAEAVQPEAQADPAAENGTVVANPNVAESQDAVDPSFVEPVSTTSDGKSFTGWTEIETEIAQATEPVQVSLNANNTVVPAAAIEAVKSSNTEIVLGVADAVWSIQGSTVKEDIHDVDLGIVENPGTIPTSAIAVVEDEETAQVVKTFDIKHDGEFGFDAKLIMNVGRQYEGKYANLFYYNPETGEMEVVSTSIVNDVGQATFSLSHASSYALAVSEKEIKVSTVVKDSAVEAGNKAAAKESKAEKSNTGLIIIIVVLVLAVIALAAVLILKEQARKKRHHAHHTQNGDHNGNHNGNAHK